MGTIENQKRVAKEILEKLSIIDPYAILAGGAPRDWYFDEEAKDLDFYYYTQERTMGASSKQLEFFFPKVIPSLREDGDWKLYEHMPGLKRVWNTTIEGIPVQFIQMDSEETRRNVVENMDVSICKISMNRFETTLHRDFKLTVGSGKMFLKEGYSWNDPHPTKMIEKYKEKFGTTYSRESAIDWMIAKVV